MMVLLLLIGCSPRDVDSAEGNVQRVGFGVSAALGEVDCTDGLDDDGDGLIDCEDGDCSAAEGCYESDCGDGLDDDGDGMEDCVDEDCWGLDICPIVRSWVVSGEMQHKIGLKENRRYGGVVSSMQEELLWTTTVELTEVSGAAEVWVSSTWVPCNWGFDAGAFERRVWSTNLIFGGRSYLYTGTSSTFNRSGFELSKGCPISTSYFLPGRLSASGRAVQVDRETRYSGFVAGSQHRTDSRFFAWGGSGGGSGVFTSYSSWWTRSLDAGGTWTFGE